MGLSHQLEGCAQRAQASFGPDRFGQDVSPEMLDLLQQLRKKVVIGFVGGSDLPKQQEQLGVHGRKGNCRFISCARVLTYSAAQVSKLSRPRHNFERQYAVIEDFDYCFAENGLTAYKLGKEFASQSFIGWLGEEKYKKLANFVLHYIADLDIPVKRCSSFRALSDLAHVLF